ncbi:MAG TPA: alanine--tRNA ligase [Actinomycetota bacterium]|nr:alanine--tRNA ligase [Actinomycetota bacterium]
MDSSTIRDRFFDFFEARDHARVPSSSLVPNDPTLLLTNAGMNQFKPYFLGEQNPPFKRAMSVQKCFRATDIDEVGKTSRHLTFFEMLGNFSFGDYYKELACPWAWELVTEGWGIEEDRLWATVYETDDEARQIWIDSVGVPESRVIRRGRKDNYWDMGVEGPCGPCSEIFVDLGPEFGEESPDGPAGNEDRYLEIWNLVFMQNMCNASIEPVEELPNKNIDTGAGVERLAMVLQKVKSIYETDTLGGLVRRAGDLTKREYGSDARTDMSLRVLGDHGRSLTFLIADGVLPSNEERGYVLRRVMRRAVRHARLLGRDEPILVDLIDATVELMGDVYPEVRTRRDFIVEVATREEERFAATLRQGESVLQNELKKAPSGGTLPGDVAFQLHDTFGFPIDMTKEIVAETGQAVDMETFDKLMQEQRERARAARSGGDHDSSAQVLASLVEEKATTEFDGYEHLRSTSRVMGISNGVQSLSVAPEGSEVDVVLDRTVFYPEGGGQVGDRGTLESPAATARVVDTQRLVPGLIGHRVQVVKGELAVGDEVEAIVDPEWRSGSQKAHTATHILHWILRDRLGEHARQAGSLVEPGRLRFDFNHFEALDPERVADISNELQGRVNADDGVRAYETSYDFARSIGAMAIFGEKYGDFVRVVEVGDYSKELCGGTHVPHSSQIGVVVVTGEGSVGANLRRIEALVGDQGLDYLKRKVDVLQRTADVLKSSPDEVVEKVERLLEQQKEMERKLGVVERASAEVEASDLAAAAEDIDGTRLVVARRDEDVDSLRRLAQQLKGKLGSAVVVLGSAGEGRANLVAAATKDVVAKGVSASDLLAHGASLLEGGAGGKPELAISGGPKSEMIDEAIEAVASAARTALRS